MIDRVFDFDRVVRPVRKIIAAVGLDVVFHHDVDDVVDARRDANEFEATFQVRDVDSLQLIDGPGRRCGRRRPATAE